MPVLDLEKTYLGLDGKGRVTPLPVGPLFWETVKENPEAAGTLVTAHTGEGDWDHWEIHPSGDEVLILLEGNLQFVFERADGEDIFDVVAGSTLIIPAGTWHRARAQRNARMIFITFGVGTTHKPMKRA